MKKQGIKFDENTKGLKGHWKLDIYKGDIQTPENYLETIEGENLIVTEGKGQILDRLFGLSAVVAPTRITVGTNNAAAAVGNTLATFTGPAEHSAFDTVSRSSLVVTCVSTFGTGVANIVWAELGISNTTLLLNRIAPIGPFTKTSAVSIVVTVTITQA